MQKSLLARLGRKEIYEALHPETKQATGRELAEKRWNATETISTASFADDTAQKSGLTARTIRQEVQIATGLPAPTGIRTLHNGTTPGFASGGRRRARGSNPPPMRRRDGCPYFAS